MKLFQAISHRCALGHKQVITVSYSYLLWVSLWYRVKHWDFWSLIEKGSGAINANFYLGDFGQ